MSKYNRYVFRVYNIGKPNEGTKDFFKDRYKGDDTYYMSSPYVSSGNHHQYEINKYKKLGQVQKESSRAKWRPDYLNRTSDNYANLMRDHKTKDDKIYTLMDKGKEIGRTVLLPHRGISVIGLADPQYSLYRPWDIHMPMAAKIDDSRIWLNTPVLRSMGDVGDAFVFDSDIPNLYQALKDNFGCASFIAHINDKDGTVLSSKKSSGIDYDKLVSDINSAWRFWRKDPANNNYLIASKNGESSFGLKPNRYTRMLGALGQTIKNTGANGFVLASIPEDALYKASDVKNGILRGQRDFPEELVVKRLKPIQMYSGNQLPEPDPLDYGDTIEDGLDSDEFAEALNKWRHSLKFNNPVNSTMDIVEDIPSDGIFQDLDKLLRSTRFKTAADADREDMSKQWIFDHFQIDPDADPKTSNTFVSDETKKNIYMDLSNWYNKQSSQENITNALTQGGRRWQ